MLERLLSIPKTVYINLRCFDLDEAIRFRVKVSYKVKLKGLYRGCIEFRDPNGRLSIGFGKGSFEMGRGCNGSLIFGKNGVIKIKDNAVLPAGIIMNCYGTISLGSNFSSNACLLLSCENEVTIGDNPAIGWNVSIVDDDGHDVMDWGGAKNKFSRECPYWQQCLAVCKELSS